MSLIERWGVAATDQRTLLRCGSQLSHNLKLFPNERRESLLLVKGNGEDVLVLMWASCEERAKEQQKGGGTQEGPET